jgi:hypothetical protein
MKKILMALGLAAVSLHSMASPNVGVSVSVGQPGFYGRIDIGNAPQAAVIYPQPVIIQRPPAVLVHRPPIYLRVPPGHQKNWGRYCGRYEACGQPVYFVRDEWYRSHYHRPVVPLRRIDHGHPHDHRHDHRDDRRDNHRDNHRGHDDHDRHDDRGHHGKGRGHN